MIAQIARITREQRTLTDEQYAYAESFANERITAILSTPTDETAAEEYLRQAYRITGIEPPRTIRWFDSPMELARELPTTLPCVRGYVKEQVRIATLSNVNRNIMPSIWEVTKAWVRDIVGAHVRTAIGTKIARSIGSPDYGVWRTCVDALFDQDDCAFLWFFHELYQEHGFIHFAKFNEQTHGYFLGEQEAWLVRKGVVIDEYIHYPDGWEVVR